MEPTGFLSKPADMEHHCVSRRCQLCRFTILPGEAVIADINGHLSTIFASTAVSHLDKGLRAVFRLCSHLCSHYKGQVPGYHAACLAYAYVIPSRQFLRAVAYEYEPGLAEDRRRRRRIRDLLADKIGQAYGFPLELCCMTADELVCMSAVHTIQQVWGARRSAGGQFDISRGLWADYVHIDGLRYVANLFDRPGLSVGGSAVLSVDKASLVDVLYVLEDHLGVRQLVFGHQQQDITRSLVGVTKKRDQWWRTIVLSPVDRKLEAKSDGLKIRAIRSGSEPDAANMTWSLPISPPVRDEICLLPYAPYSSLPLRSQQMTALDCNVPGVTGYSIGWAGNLMRIHAHHGGAGGEDLAVYRELGEYRSDVLWTHMPVEPGELISEIWVRYGGEYAHMAVMLETTRGKRMTVGVHPSSLASMPLQELGPRWLWVCSLNGRPCRLFFNLSDRGIHRIGIQRAALLRPAEPFPTPSPVRVFSSPKLMRPNYFFSVARLDHVVQITPCRVRLASHSPVVGFLLRYADGMRACVGEYRLDAAGAPLAVDPSQRLRLGFAFSDAVPFHVATVEVGPDRPRRPDESPYWLSLPWRGRIEWWFTHGHCQVYHVEPAGPNPNLPVGYPPFHHLHHHHQLYSPPPGGYM